MLTKSLQLGGEQGSSPAAEPLPPFTVSEQDPEPCTSTTLSNSGLTWLTTFLLFHQFKT